MSFLKRAKLQKIQEEKISPLTPDRFSTCHGEALQKIPRGIILGLEELDFQRKS